MNTYTQQKGFTLIELMVSIAIMGILTAILATGYAHQSAARIIERNAIEFALQVREAQVYALGDKQFQGGGYPGYGVFVNPITNSYLLFADVDKSNSYNGSTTECTGECISITQLTGGNHLAVSCGGGRCGGLNIVFPAHQLTPIINAIGGNSDITFTTDRAEGVKKVVHVYSTGIVEVVNQ
jgi:prepilin-type N-terminal cleavage/methylation domain-containing protein